MSSNGEPVFAYAVAGALLPVLLWLRFFYTRDRFDREPKRLIFKLFIVGALPVAFLAGLVNVSAQLLLSTVLGEAAVLFGLVVFVAPLGEETLKYLGTSRFSRRHRAFDEPVDGMIYGSTVGLGFAAAETVDYLTNAYLGIDAFGSPTPGCSGLGCLLGVAVIRGAGTALLHAIATGISGYFLSRRVLDRRPRGTAVGGVLLAALIHAAWNGSPFAYSWIVLLVGALIYWRLMRRALRRSPHHARQLLRPESPLLPPGF